MATNKIIVTGKVQGVYFRASAKQKALNLGVKGFVRNEADGSVLLEIEGEQAAVNSMANWCKNGPGLARITNYEITEEVAKNYVSFDIKK